MVNNVTSLTGNGLKDWLIQRVTAVYFAVYVIFLLGYILSRTQLTYADWYALFHEVWLQVASAIALLSLLLHTWVGLWTVTTDYLKCTALRLTVQLVVLMGLIGQFVWGLMIVWGR